MATQLLQGQFSFIGKKLDFEREKYFDNNLLNF